MYSEQPLRCGAPHQLAAVPFPPFLACMGSGRGVCVHGDICVGWGKPRAFCTFARRLAEFHSRQVCLGFGRCRLGRFWLQLWHISLWRWQGMGSDGQWLVGLGIGAGGGCGGMGTDG